MSVVSNTMDTHLEQLFQASRTGEEASESVQVQNIKLQRRMVDFATTVLWKDERRCPHGEARESAVASYL